MLGKSVVRLTWLDCLRGFALLQMMLFHTAYDAVWMGWAHWPLHTGIYWQLWRTTIVTQFLLICGVSLSLRFSRNDFTLQFWKAFFQRWAQVAAAALLVSAVSYLIFGPRWIQFGVLHCIAIATLLSTLLVAAIKSWPRALVKLSLLISGVILILIGWKLKHSWFDVSPANWIGLTTVKPHTEDYVPLLPWLGVVWLGLGFGASLVTSSLRFEAKAVMSQQSMLCSCIYKALTWLGRNSLSTYLLHQPLILAFMWLMTKSLPN